MDDFYNAHTPVDWADAGHAVIVTHSLCQQSVSDLPGKHGGVLAFVISDFVDDFGCSNLWFGASDHPWSDAACLIVPVEQTDRELYITRQDKQRVRIYAYPASYAVMSCGQCTVGY